MAAPDKWLHWALGHIPRPWLIRLSMLTHPLWEPFFRGAGPTDPINGRQYRRFLPYGYGKLRPGALSPGTLSLERHRALWLYIQEHTDWWNTPKKVLHIAPEQIFHRLFRKNPLWDVTSLDLHSPLADIRADITRMPLPGNHFDLIFCNHVLEHIPDDREAMRELFRVLRPGGTAIVQIPLDATRESTFEDPSITDPEKRAELFGQYDHVRVYGMDFFDRLEAAGFRTEKIRIDKLFTPAEIGRYGLDKHEILPLAHKPEQA